MSDNNQMPVTAKLDEGNSRHLIESQLGKLAQEIGAKTKLIVGLQHNDRDIAAQSKQVSSALQAGLKRTWIRISNLKLDQGAENAFMKAVNSLGSKASSVLEKAVTNASKQYMPAAFQW